ncbi:Z-ring associated protein ZapG [Vibrio mangrovi]|uniref:Z-ring associated protein G n=1 Tax=Vibrio mangrovi TaxID=474394 RepID=A0A1Y6IVY7_9VIBR|nr:Z-ring associated protein ZapG [Vibrio mangrovi]MDW6001761.1 Z-ring associated protein ZapG [Vibrio mangrovi]SMS00213.1 Inner membrane protein YhcB [Vibrio mangrovi]
MPWIYTIVGLLIGCVVGVVIARLTTPQYKNQKSLQKDLDSAKFALEQQRQELMDHFAQTAEMLDIIGKDYTKLYQHLAKTSSELVPNLPEQDNPFIKTIVKHKEPDTESQNAQNQNFPPKDYALGASGMLRDEEKPIIHSKDIVNAQVS